MAVTPAPVRRPVRVLVVDDDPLVRQALAMVLGGAADLLLVAEAADGDEVEAAVLAHRPDVILMDVRMVRVDGLEATARVRSGPWPPGVARPEVVVLTTLHVDEDVVRAIAAGASGFLLKDAAPAEIVEALRRVAAGEAILAPAVTRGVMDALAAGSSDQDQRVTAARRRLALLADRERQIAVAVGRGLSNAEIAAELHLSVATVKAHVSRVLTRLDLDNRVQIALLVHDAG